MSYSNSSDFNISAACACNRGLRRANNEDNFYFDGKLMDSDNDGLEYVLTCSQKVSGSGEDDGCFFAVFDGMGGGQYGEIASYTAAIKTYEFLDEHVPDDYTDVAEMLTDMTLILNDAVFAESSERAVNQMGSTMVGCYFYDGDVWCCNTGDSKCSRLRDGELEQISVDHTDAETMKLNGITGRKPYVTRYLGIDGREMRVVPAIFRDSLKDGDTLLISSDGLTDMVTPEKITEILMGDEDEEEKAQALLVEALKNGGRDNVTILICKVTADQGE